MDKSRENLYASIGVAILTFAVTFLILTMTYFPMEQQWREQTIKDKCPNGLETCGLIIEPSPISNFFWVPSIVVFFLVYHHLEEKRKKEQKSWRSYN